MNEYHSSERDFGMSLLVVGSMAFDSIKSPFGEVERVVGGWLRRTGEAYRVALVQVDAKTGERIWRFYTVTEEPKEQGKDKFGRRIFGPSGVGVWSTVAIHPEEKRLYLTTGDDYTKPESHMSIPGP